MKREKRYIISYLNILFQSFALDHLLYMHIIYYKVLFPTSFIFNVACLTLKINVFN